MKLLRMTATFGKLDHATLDLTDGLNVLTRENEDGKSTWAEFLVAMFYGVDTRDKRSSGHIPAKEKYAPWSGKAMEGSIDLIDNQGREITIERSAAPRTPMGKLIARDTKTGEVIESITAENCAETLLGVERSVFQRSAFIGQNSAQITSDAALEQRLRSLITSGDEQTSYSAAAERLKKEKNRLTGTSRNALLPPTRAALKEVNDALEKISESHERDLELYAELREAEQKKARMVYIRDCLRASEAQKQAQARLGAQQAAQKASETLAALQKETAALPQKQQLSQLHDRLHDLNAEQKLLQETAAPQAPSAPEAPAGFDCAAADAPRTAEQAAAKLRELQTAKKQNFAWLLAAAIVFVLGGAALFALSLPVFSAAALAIGVAAGIARIILKNKAAKKLARKKAEADALLASFAAETPEQILSAAARYAEAERNYQAQKQAYENALRERGEQENRLQQQTADFLSAVRLFAPDCSTLSDAGAAIGNALASLNALETAQNRAEDTQKILDSMPEAEAVAPPAEDFTAQYTLAEAERDLAASEQALQTLREELARHEAVLNQLGDPNVLTDRRETLLQREAHLQAQLDALELAQQTLADADAELRRQFAPQLAKAAKEKMQILTDGRYSEIMIQQDMTMEAKTVDDTVSREMLMLSGGTLNQLYLALRLAICDLILPEDTPLILDDAFAFYDDKRLANALKLLKKEAEKRQILVFTCQNREAQILSEVQA